MATTGAPTASRLPHNYKELYTQQATTLEGHHARFYAAFHTGTGNTADELLNAIVLSTQSVPKLLLARVTLPDLTQRIIVLHRPSIYEQDLRKPTTVWNDCATVFTSNIDANSCFLETVVFPATAFEITDAQMVPTLADSDAQLAATAHQTLGPYTTGTANTNNITTLRMMPVPPRYVDIVFGKTFTPHNLWAQLANTIAADCVPLIDWLHVALIHRHNVPPNANTQPPANHLGTRSTALPIATKDCHIARHRWDIIRRDIPALSSPAHLAPNNQLLHMFGALRQDHAAHFAAEDACCLANKQDKLPSESKYKTIALDWMQFCSVSNKTDLPPVYHQLSNADKADHITILRTAVHDCA